ncbi:MAG: MoxR family ATPase [Nanoarchaeota archaeon]|nr:MoxR family ATPase [Nanoarchaeota archaeon]
MPDKAFIKKIEADGKVIENIKREVAKAVVGQDAVIDSLITAIIANGNVLLEGVPGIAKTLIVRTFSKVMGCSFSRIQFTPDLLPTDITGITAYDEKKGFYVVKGPIFANFILADEINRAPPKVQSVLLESMQEKQVTIGKETFVLKPPFFILATQNPIESLGTYPLPEAQVDRFLFKLFIDYPSEESEQLILNQNISIHEFGHFKLNPIVNGRKILELQQHAKGIFVDPKIEKYIVNIVTATRKSDKFGIKLGKYIEWGSSPRASIGLYIAAKARALQEGKHFATPHNVKQVAVDVLRHRVLLNYEGQSENITPDMVIKEILDKVPIP